MSLRELLHDKALAEYRQFINYLMTRSPEEIIRASYKKAMYDDILMIFAQDNVLSEKQIAALLSLDNPLNECYYEWIDTDCSHMEMLTDTIRNCAEWQMKRTDK